MVKSWMKYIDKLSNKEKIIFREIIKKILFKNFEGLDIIKMHGNTDKYRCRVGNKRVIFEIKNQKIEILKIGPRGDIYK